MPDRATRIAVWGGIAYAVAATSLVAALVVRSATEAGAQLAFAQALAWQGAIYATWILALPLLRWMARRERVRTEPWWVGMMRSLAAGAPFALAHAAFASVVDRAFGVERDFAQAFIARLPVDFLILWTLTGIAYAAAYYDRYARQRANAAQLEAQLARAQLQALKSRLRPHFLFNALNALTVLIRKEPEAAERMTRHLADLLRASLARGDEQFVTLRAELDLLRDYLAIEQVRFGDRLRVEFDIAPGALELAVPDLLLQPLVENALKHGLGPKRGPGTVRIRAALAAGVLQLDVQDDGAGLARPFDDGVGLAVTAERLHALYGETATLQLLDAVPGPGALARVTIPVPPP